MGARQTVRLLWVAVASTGALVGEPAVAEPTFGVLRVHVTRRDCRGCGQPQADDRPVARAIVNVWRREDPTARPVRRRTGARGVAPYRLRAGEYCAATAGGPTAGGPTAAGPTAVRHPARDACAIVRPGATVDLHVDASGCPPLECSGREP